MANPERGELALTVGDRTYTLVTDYDAICQIEKLMSDEEGRIVNMAEVYVGAAHMSYRHLRAIIWGALRQFHPDMTSQQAGDLIMKLGGPEKFLAVVRKLRQASEPEGKGRPRQARQTKRKAGARTTSTPGASA